jgi:hypothetical protein
VFIGVIIALVAVMALYFLRQPLGWLLGKLQRCVTEGSQEAQQAYKEGLKEDM